MMEIKKLMSLEIWNNEFYIPSVLGLLDSVVGQHRNADFSRYNRFRFVVGEILKVRMVNAYPSGKGLINIEFSIRDNFIVVEIKDKGKPGWYDFSYETENIDENSNDFSNYILDKWIDSVCIEKLGKEGQRIVIRQRINNPIEFRTPEPYPETEALDTNITIRPVVTETDVVEAIRCIYSEYGYSYSYEKLYYVDSFMRMVQNGELMSFLAVNEHGQTAGHFALAFSDLFKNMPEVSTVVIMKEFRGLGLFGKFMNYSIEIAEKLGVRALMGQPVAFHSMSQKALLRAGFTATTILLSYINSDIESEYNENKQRLDVFSSVKILDKNAKSIAYPPNEITPFIRKVYDKLDWQYELRDSSELSDAAEISIEENGLMQFKRIIVNNSSSDLEQLLTKTVKDSIRKKYEMIEIFISLNSPSCEHGYQTAKKCRFVLSGIIPGGENGDYIIMQMLLKSERNYDKLVTVGDFEELTNDITQIIDNYYDKEKIDL